MVQPYNIGVKVGADIDPLRKELTKGSASLSQFADKSRSALTSVAKSFAVTGAAGVTALTAVYKIGSDLTDQQAKMARALGGTTASFAALTYAADKAGISMASLENDVRKMNAQLVNPSDKAYETLRKLNLSAQDLLNMDLDTRIATIADRFKGLGYTVAQIDAELKNLSLKKSDISKLFYDGGDAIRSAREEMRAYGLEISEIDAANIENANDAATRAKTVWTGIAQLFAAQVSPYVEAAINKLTAMGKTGEGVGSLVAKSLNGIITALSFTADAAGGVSRIFEVVGHSIASMVLGLKADILSLTAVILEKPIAAVNDLIFALNKLPKMDITPISRPEIVQGLIDSAWEAHRAFEESKAGIDEILMRPLPGESFRTWTEEVKKAADDAAEAMVNARSKMTSAKPMDEFDGVKGDVFDTESDIRRRNQPIDTFDLDGEDPFATEQELFVKHWEEMNRIAVEGAGGISQIMAQQWGNAVGSTAAAGKSMMESFSQSSRKMFEINKAWGVADAIVSTAQGIAAGVKLGWPMGIPAVAWAVANGAAQISRIRSTQFGGGGGSPAATTSAPAQGQAAPGTNALGGQESGRTLRIEGLRADSLYTGNQLQNLATNLEEFWNDGGGKGRVIFAGDK